LELDSFPAGAIWPHSSNFRHELIEGNTPPGVAVRPLGDSILDPGGNMQSQLIIPRFPKLVEMVIIDVTSCDRKGSKRIEGHGD
jgi:hypothetical protein